jgi:hypothetical protein
MNSFNLFGLLSLVACVVFGQASIQRFEVESGDITTLSVCNNNNMINIDIIDYSYIIDAKCDNINSNIIFEFEFNINDIKLTCLASNLTTEWAISAVEDWEIVNDTMIDTRYSYYFYANSTCIDDYILNNNNNNNNNNNEIIFNMNINNNECNVDGHSNAIITLQCEEESSTTTTTSTSTSTSTAAPTRRPTTPAPTNRPTRRQIGRN